ncbi:hypothetical protein MUY14_36340 [Amycolatopsis sp. FBCC-B4732]|uniref:hypothetical protein n=1 Tax=Amycolatopsis sp. FBCC-B4732 TaxID=3079339 RepID=UPI001FF1CA6C|nr:hypothetical protein [Amycolatopsis sp. FBCC-B4732]UOX87154.1 hypothetical protein MUY14_36340 [Amycolatopsis sp. FBCC-B4732]
MGRTLSRVAGIVSAGALITAATAPAALAQTDTTAPETTTTTSSETTTTTAPSTTGTTTTAPSTSETTGTTTTPSVTGPVKTDAPDPATSTTATSEPPKDDYQDNVGHGFVGLGGEGVLVIACAAGRPGDVATQYLSVTGGPDQDEADGRYWNYSVRVVDAPAGTTTAKFSWTCAGVEGNGVVEFEQEQPPVTSTSSSSTVPSSTAPVTTATSATTTSTSATTTSTSAAPGSSAPKAQVKVAPKGGVETGFGGTAW